MRIIRVSIIAFILLFVISVSWYVSQPPIIGLSRALNSTYYEDANARNVATAIEYGSIAWGPVVDLFILIWWAMSASARDVESDRYD